MLDLDEQIGRLADAAFEQTSPVNIASKRTTTPKRIPWLLAAAAVALVIVGVATTLGQLRDSETSLDTAAQTTDQADDGYRFSDIDPLRLDLDGAIDVSLQQRLDSVGPLLTFDLDALPEGWTAEQRQAVTSAESFFSEGPTYNQDIAVTSPSGTRFTVNLIGLLSAELLDARIIDRLPTQVRDQPPVIGDTGLQWIEQGRLFVWITRGVNELEADISAEMLALGDLLEPITTELTWDGGDAFEAAIGVPSPDSIPLLAGELAGNEWAVAQNGVDLRLLFGEDLRRAGGISGITSTSLDDGVRVDYAINSISMPGGSGVLVVGRSPGVVTLVRLHLSNAVVDLPVVAMEGGQVAFAVPIDDRLDPLRITLHGENETMLATIALEFLPPYLGGGLANSVGLDS